MSKIFPLAFVVLLLIIPTFSVSLTRVYADDYPHDPRGEITDVVIYPSLPSYQGETPLVYVEFHNPTATTYHYLVVVNIYDSNGIVVYDSDIEGENIDGNVNGGDIVSWGPWEYTIPYDAAVGTWHILAGLRLYPWDPELDYMGLSWCEPEKTFEVKPSHETITNKVGGPYDYDGDSYYDSVWIEVKAGTNAEEDVDVEVYGNLMDPDGDVVDNEGSGVWTVPAGGESWGYRFYLFVPGGSPVGRYSVDLYLYDASHRNTYPDHDPEHIWINAYSYDPLYPPGFQPNTPPILSSGSAAPPQGDTSTLFEYSVHYYDPDDDPPAQREISIDGNSWHQMTLDNGPAYDGTYKYWSPLSEGAHTYFFKFSDGVNPPVTDPPSGTHSGPYVKATLTVFSPHDNPVPGNGDHYYDVGEYVTVSVTSPVIEDGNVWTCIGWSGTGSVPSSGSKTTVGFTITQDSTITWLWQEELFQIHFPTITNSLQGLSFQSLMDYILTGKLADDTIEVEVTPPDMVQDVVIKLSGTFPDTFQTTRTESNTFVTQIVIQNPQVIVDFMFTFTGAFLPGFVDVIGPQLSWQAPVLMEIVATDIYGGVHSRTFDLPLPTGGDPLHAFYGESPSTSVMALSPVDILVTDSFGQRVGALYENGQFVGIVREIPGAFYARNNVPNGAKYIYLPFSNSEFEILAFGNNTANYNLTAFTIMDQDFNGNFSITEDGIEEGEQIPYFLSVSSEGVVTLDPHVQNLNTGYGYATIQKAINAPETLNGHTIKVLAGIYYEKVVINKTLTLIGENRNTTIIDGSPFIDRGFYTDVVVRVDANNTKMSHLTVRNGSTGIKANQISYLRIENMDVIDYFVTGISLSRDNQFAKMENVSVIGLGRWKDPYIGNYGIEVHYSPYVEISNAFVSSNAQGIKIHGSGSAIISDCFLRDNGVGVGFKYQSQAMLRRNTLANNTYGMYFYNSYTWANHFYHNNFINNEVQVRTSSANHGQLDNGYPSGGNYWSDYAGNDLISGPYQNETGSDGIGDTSYTIDANNADNYPLIQPYFGPVRNLNTGQSYFSIQESINNATANDRILILSGVYFENVVVNKTLSLVGEDRNTTIIDGNFAGTVITLLAGNVNVTGLTIQNSGWHSGGFNSYGILAASGDPGHNYISCNIIRNNWKGIRLQSDDNTVSGNTIVDNSNAGIDDWSWGVGNNISGNNITRNSVGIALNCLNSSVSGNSITENMVGIDLEYSSYNIISENDITANADVGIYMVDECLNNIIFGNNIVGNRFGIYLECLDWISEDNLIYHNNFLGNGEQAFDKCDENVWDYGYPFGGNYWSDYAGNDLLSGPYQNETGSDGIGDIPYTIDGAGARIDRYPLVSPWPTRIIERTIKIGGESYTLVTESNTTMGDVIATRNTLHFNASGPTGQGAYINVTFPVGLNKTAIKVFINDVKLTYAPFPIITSNGTHYFVYFEFTLSSHNIIIQYAIADMAITDVTSSKTVVGQGYSLSINVTVENQGDYTETLNATVYANATIIGTQNVTIASGNSTVITFTWNTAGCAKGNYTISAYAWPVPGEIETANNNCTDGWVIVAMVGDVNADGIVNIIDLATIGVAWASRVGDPLYNPNADIVDDGFIDIADLATCAYNYLKTDP